jgi:hypothetical protein
MDTPQHGPGAQIEVMYRVDAFRRFLPNRGSSGNGLIQFFGPRASRKIRFKRRSRNNWKKFISEWVADMPDGHLHTVELTSGLRVRKK